MVFDSAHHSSRCVASCRVVSCSFLSLAALRRRRVRLRKGFARKSSSSVRVQTMGKCSVITELHDWESIGIACIAFGIVLYRVVLHSVHSTRRMKLDGYREHGHGDVNFCRCRSVSLVLSEF